MYSHVLQRNVEVDEVDNDCFYFIVLLFLKRFHWMDLLVLDWITIQFLFHFQAVDEEKIRDREETIRQLKVR